jgi:hypothetical protein
LAWYLKLGAEERLALAQVEQSKYLAEKSLKEEDPERALEIPLVNRRSNLTPHRRPILTP